jgi:hypothetical protein
MKLEKKMMQKTARLIIPAWLVSVAILISGAHYNVAHAAQDNPKKPELRLLAERKSKNSAAACRWVCQWACQCK